MGEKTITTQVKIADNITPDFSKDWEIEYKGEKYIHPLRTPQAKIDNTSRQSTIDMTFQHWAMYQLKRWMFFTVQPIETGTSIPDKYIASVNLNLGDLCELFKQVLKYYFGDNITLDLNPAWSYKSEPAVVSIEHSYIWDVLIKLYELFAVRWVIERVPALTDKYVIKVGYDAPEVGHIFEHGFNGGLLSIERQVQDTEIRNMLLGRGGTKNIPYRYFKDVDPENPSFLPDPDWIPELKDIVFTELHGKTFRDYVKGWKTNTHRQLKNSDGTSIKPYGQSTPIGVESYNSEYAKTSFAYKRGHEDEKFDPIEYVKDDASIARYGELFGGLGNNDEIYPTIQNVEIAPYGRIDEVIAVQKVESDNIPKATEEDAKITDFPRAAVTTEIAGRGSHTVKIRICGFTVPQGRTANFDCPKPEFVVNKAYERRVGNRGVVMSDTSEVELKKSELKIYNSTTDEPLDYTMGLPPGTYYAVMNATVWNAAMKYPQGFYRVTVSVEWAKLLISTGESAWTNTFDIWVKNIWNTTRQQDEKDEAYALRVWKPILGDISGGKAKVSFSDGALGLSQDYEFIIADIPVYERKLCKWESTELGQVVNHEYYSEWKITLAKSDADYEALGVFIPSVQRQAVAGDHFYLTGIDIPMQYAINAEDKLDKYKTDELSKLSDIRPTWSVTLDRVKCNQSTSEATALINQMIPGNSVRIADKRLIPNSAYEQLYLQSVTITYRETTNDDNGLNPDVSVVLSSEYETSANPVAQLSSDVSAIQSQLSGVSNIQQVVRVVGDKLYLRKDGASDRSVSPTEFASSLNSTGFKNGMIGGKGWGFFKDQNNKWVLEVDGLNVREQMQTNSIVINQAEARGGMVIESPASLVITEVVEKKRSDNDPIVDYVCYFDQKQGSVANLFRENDIAFCMEFNPDGTEARRYKRTVKSVAAEYVILTGGTQTQSPNDVWGDVIQGGVTWGAGVPQVGDNIICYGSTTDKSRQSVIIRDVVNGGYERYLEGLNSVTATGSEYYFAGKQAGMYNNKPRFYIGSDTGYIKFEDNQLSIKAKLDINSTIDNKPITQYLKENGSLYQICLDNDMAAVSCDANGNMLSSTYPTTKVRVYRGPTEIKSGIEYSIVDHTGISNASISADGVVTVSGWMSQDSVEIKIKAVLPEVALTTTFTLYKVKAGAIGPTGAPGVNGQPQYLHIAYGIAISGTLPHPDYVNRFQTTAFDEARYMGVYTDFNPQPSEDFRKYSWSQIRGNAGDWTSYIFKRSDTNKPNKPTDTNKMPVPTDEGWVDAPTGSGVWWMCKATISGVNYQRSSDWSDPVQVTGKNGKDGITTVFAYRVNTSPTLAPELTQEQGSTIQPFGWSLTPPNVAYSEYLWMTSCEFEDGVRKGKWTYPVRISGEKGDKGDTGAPSVVYSLEPSVSSITRDLAGVMSTDKITVSKYQTTGNTARALCTDKIAKVTIKSSDGLSRTFNVASIGTSTSEVLVPADATEMTFTLYDNDDRTILDRQRVPILTDIAEVDLRGMNLLPYTRRWTNWSPWGYEFSGESHEGCLVAHCNYTTGDAGTYRQIGNDNNKVNLRKSKPYTLSFWSKGMGKLNVYIYHGQLETESATPGIKTLIISKDGVKRGVEYNELAQSFDLTDTWVRHSVSFSISNTDDERPKFFLFRCLAGNEVFVAGAKLETGVVATAWSPNEHDVDYLENALNEAKSNSTTIDGGLVLTSMIKLGSDKRTRSRETLAGISGIDQSTDDLSSPAIWAGGDFYDAARTDLREDEKVNSARFMIRMDGTGYAAGNTLRFKERCLAVSDSDRQNDLIVLDNTGLHLLDDSTGEEKLSVADIALDESYIQATEPIISETIDSGLSNISVYRANDGTWPVVGLHPSVLKYTRYIIDPKTSAETAIVPSQKLPQDTLVRVKFRLGIPWPKSYEVPIEDFYITVRIYKIGTPNPVKEDIFLSYWDRQDGVMRVNVDMSYVILQSASYRITYQIFTLTPYGTFNYAIPISGKFLSGSVTATKSIASKTTIGNNGIATLWDGTLLLATKEGITMRSGKFGLKVSPKGIEYNKDGTKDWKPLV